MNKHQNPIPPHPLKHSPYHTTKLAKGLKRFILVAVILVVILGALAAYFGLSQHKTQSQTSTKEQLLQAVDDTQVKNVKHTITSSLGFQLSYSNPVLKATGQVTDPSSDGKRVSGQEYEAKELDTERPYSIVRLTIPSKKTGELSIQQPQFTILTNIRKDYWNSRLADRANAGKSKLEIMVKQTTEEQQKIEFTLDSSADVTINNVSYKKLTYKRADNSYGIQTEQRTVYYLTVQNDRPYFLSLDQITASNQDTISLLELIVQSVSYAAPSDASLSAQYRATTAADVIDELPAGTSNVPSKLSDDSLIKVVAVNQPAVVRIGTLHCASVNLLLPDGSVGTTLPKACNGAIGSGSFVSSDGYIATNGHVTRITPRMVVSGYVSTASSSSQFTSRVSQVLKYLVQAGFITQDQARDVITAYNAQDPSAMEKLSSLGSVIPTSMISLKNDTYSYAIQTSDEPMHLETNLEDGFDYSDTIIPASFVDADVDEAMLDGGIIGELFMNSQYSDVSILKAKGKFPVVTLGTIDGLKQGDSLTAIGYPAFVDGGLGTKQSKTVPSITQGVVEEIGAQSSQNNDVLILTTVPIAEGNSGGPAFNEAGKQIGLNTYGRIDCEDHKCFGNGTARDIADYKRLLRKNNITLSTNSQITNNWKAGLTALTTEQYQTAYEKLKSVTKDYPANYLAEKFFSIAQKEVDAIDAKNKEGLLRWVLIGGAIVLLLAVVAGVILIVHLIRPKQPRLASVPTSPAGPMPVSPPISPYPPASAPVPPTSLPAHDETPRPPFQP